MPKTSTKLTQTAAYRATQRTVQNGNSTILLSEPESQSLAASQTITDLNQMLDSAITDDDWRLVFRNMLALSTGKGMVAVKAAELLLKYKYGLPATITPPSDAVNSRITVIEVVRTQGTPQTEIDEAPALPEPQDEPDVDEKLITHIEQAAESSEVPF